MRARIIEISWRSACICCTLFLLWGRRHEAVALKSAGPVPQAGPGRSERLCQNLQIRLLQTPKPPAATASAANPSQNHQHSKTQPQSELQQKTQGLKIHKRCKKSNDFAGANRFLDLVGANDDGQRTSREGSREPP